MEKDFSAKIGQFCTNTQPMPKNVLSAESQMQLLFVLFALNSWPILYAHNVYGAVQQSCEEGSSWMCVVSVGSNHQDPM